MKLSSLGYKSELIFTSFDGKVEDRDSYLVMRTLTNPNFFWGNLLIFDRPPKPGDFKSWVSQFKKEFPDPRIYHVTLGWDSNDGTSGDVSEFLENGFELEIKAVLSASSVIKPPKFNEYLVVRPITSDDEWSQMVNLQVESAHDNLPPEEWRKFYESQKRRYQAMTKASLGHWYGGFLEGRLVAGLGIFHREGIGRFQSVCTSPHYRRQGLCGTLVYLSALHAFDVMGAKDLVMCADPDYYAIKIYESVGFKKVQTEHGVYWWDRSHDSKQATESYIQASLETKRLALEPVHEGHDVHGLAEKMGMAQIDLVKNADVFKGSTSDGFVFSKKFETTKESRDS